MNDQPREEKPPSGADQPTAEQPTAAHGTPTEPELSRESSGPDPALSRESAAGGTAGAGQASGAGAADQTAVHGQQPPPAPPTPQLSQPGPGQAYAAWGPQAAPRQPGGFRRFVGHRATQLVGVGVLGLLVGGGIVGGIAAATHHGPRDGRPGIHRQYDGPNGNQGFNGRGPGFGGRGNTGNTGNSGSGDGI
ncbi:hypothetical protein Q5425_09050 [Amycolatopsis sp. A133]|uniref:hypothetical protein n=1 Tax=Amycolatopsis sp. A133 TaxID=3064472 RepID=UPI0027F71488|nr:hypothetical protein [Amycolatopsis sp. A133]MDQ7803879.1 hypothetical protein [Amycolatopsis sp. A133]